MKILIEIEVPERMMKLYNENPDQYALDIPEAYTLNLLRQTEDGSTGDDSGLSGYELVDTEDGWISDCRRFTDY